jgi:hypothetical protein
MATMFSKGVIKASGRLQEMRNDLSDLISVMEARVDLHAFDKKHPGLVPASIADLKEASKYIYRALERLNFPDNFNSPEI